MTELIQDIDAVFLLWVNSLNNPYLDQVMWWISSKYIWLPLYLFLIIIVFKTYKIRQAFVIISIILLSVGLSDLISVHLFKNVFMRLRPSHEPDLQGLVHFVNGYKGGLYGFVSSHAANVFSLAYSFTRFYKKNWILNSFFIWAFIVSLSRVYLRVHYPGDVICGAILGTMIASFVYFLFKKINLLPERCC